MRAKSRGFSVKNMNSNLTEKEQELIEKLRQLPPYAKMTIEKRAGEIYRYTVETSNLFEIKTKV